MSPRQDSLLNLKQTQTLKRKGSRGFKNAKGNKAGTAKAGKPALVIVPKGADKGSLLQLQRVNE